MGKIAEITTSVLKRFYGSPGDSVSVNLESHGQDNGEYYQLPGFFCRPHDGAQGVVIDCNGNNIVVSAHDYRLSITTDKGETLLYSYNSSGVIQGKILIDKDGNIVINDGDDFAVKFNELKTAFDQLKSDFDLHVHNYVDSPIGSSVTSPISIPSTADMSSAKVDKVKI